VPGGPYWYASDYQCALQQNYQAVLDSNITATVDDNYCSCNSGEVGFLGSSYKTSQVVGGTGQGNDCVCPSTLTASCHDIPALGGLPFDQQCGRKIYRVTNPCGCQGASVTIKAPLYCDDPCFEAPVPTDPMLGEINLRTGGITPTHPLFAMPMRDMDLPIVL